MHPHIAASHTYEKINLSQVDFQDITFRLTPENEMPTNSKIEKSIAEIGIVHPPIIKKNKDTYQIVDGRKRLLACKDILRKGICLCLVLPESIADEEILQFLIRHMLIERSPTIIEQAYFFKKLSALQGEEKAAINFFSTMETKPSTHYLKRLSRILDLEEPIQISMHSGDINENIADKLFVLNFRDRMAIYELIDDLKLGTGKQKKLVNICLEIANRHNCSISDILAGQEVSDILQQSKGNPPQQAANIMTWLTRQQSPLMVQAEQEFKRYVASLELPDNTILEHSKSFERDSLTLSITFKNRGEFMKKWQEIKGLLKN
jgi:ParB-like chromosome segregation protein Spo0J